MIVLNMKRVRIMLDKLNMATCPECNNITHINNIEESGCNKCNPVVELESVTKEK